MIFSHQLEVKARMYASFYLFILYSEVLSTLFLYVKRDELFKALSVEQFGPPILLFADDILVFRIDIIINISYRYA